MELTKGPSRPCCNSRSSPTYPSPLERKPESPAPIQRSPVSASYLERRDPFLSWSAKNSRRSRLISRGGALHRKGERNSRVVPPFPESPRYLSPFQGNLFSLHSLDFQAEDRHRHTPRWHVGQPFGKASRESHRSLDPPEGTVTLLLQLGRKAHVHAPTRDET